MASLRIGGVRRGRGSTTIAVRRRFPRYCFPRRPAAIARRSGRTGFSVIAFRPLTSQEPPAVPFPPWTSQEEPPHIKFIANVLQVATNILRLPKTQLLALFLTAVSLARRQYRRGWSSPGGRQTKGPTSAGSFVRLLSPKYIVAFRMRLSGKNESLSLLCTH